MTEAHPAQSSAHWSFRPGSWYAALGPTTSVLLPSSEPARAAALWVAVDGGAGFEEVLDLLVADGLRALPGFVLIGTGDDGDDGYDGDGGDGGVGGVGNVRVLVRGGDAVVSLAVDGAPVELSGPPDAVWAERRVRGVSQVSVEVGDAPDPQAPSHVVAQGLVRVGSVQRVARTTTTPAEDPLVSGHHRLEDPSPPEVPVEVPAALPVEEPAPTEPITPPVASVSAVSVEPGDPADPSDQDAVTSGGSALPASSALSALPVVENPSPQVVPGGTVARLVISNGESVDVDRVILFGRAPEARPTSAADHALLVAVPSPMHEISSTHVEVRPGVGADQGTAVVTDMGSTNGTVLVRPGLGPEDLEPGIAVPLVPGATINLGDGVTISVTRP